MDFFSSDFHIGHRNILKADNAPFATIEEHDETIINRVNTLMDSKDRLFFLGDLTLWSGRRRIIDLVRRFKPELHIILAIMMMPCGSCSAIIRRSSRM